MSLVGEVQVGGCYCIEDMLGEGGGDGVSERKRRVSAEGHLEGRYAWVGAKLGGVNKVGGGELRQIIESQKTIGVWEAAVGTAELWCCPWGGSGGGKGIPGRGTEEEIVGEVTEAT